MMNDVTLTNIVVRLVEAWALSLGLLPTGNFDPDDPGCVRDYGPHRVITVQSLVPADEDSDALDLDTLDTSLTKYLSAIRLSGIPRVEPFEMGIYDCHCCNRAYLHVSVTFI